MISTRSSQSTVYLPPALASADVAQPPAQTHADPALTVSLPDGRQALKTAIGDWRDLQTLVQTLNTAIATLPEGAEPAQVATTLKSTWMPIDAQSSFRQEQQLTRPTVSLETFIKDLDVLMPLSVADLKELAQQLTENPVSHPLGNLAGALSWSRPLSVEQQRAVVKVVTANSASLEGLPLRNSGWSALDYLADAVSLSPADWQDPAKALGKLLDSPRSQALGEAIQTQLNGIATDTSVNDYVLAAIQLGLDHESIDQPSRSRIAGFNMNAQAFWNRPPALVISHLTEQLIVSGKASMQTAALGARLLLARAAPQFLVKDLPASVTIGSMAWANLCLAVARIEAQTPGKTALMSFGEVMLAAQDTPPASELAQKTVLMEWAVANQVPYQTLEGLKVVDDVESARTAFNQQQSDLKAASKPLETPMPNRKAMALALLEKNYDKNIDFEAKSLRIHNGTGVPHARFLYRYSMLDVTMQGMKLDDTWRTQDDNINLAAFIQLTNSPAYNIPTAFDEAFKNVTTAYKDIKQKLMMNAIIQLPFEDRFQFNFGDIKFFKENSYRISSVPFVGERLFHSSTTILIQTEYNAKKQSYSYDAEKGTLKKILTHPTDREPEYVSDEVTRIEEYTPDKPDHLREEKPHWAQNPNTFSNSRIQNVAAAVVKGLGIDSEAVKRLAQGRTAAEQQRDTLSSIGEFLLDLIPLRSAIVNFKNGNYKDGATDLVFDVFGLLTAGVGMVGKLANVAGKAGTAVSKLAHSGRIIGASAFSAFNPLGGLGDLTVGAGKLAIQTKDSVGAGIQKLRGTATGAELVEASKHFDSAATGTFKAGERTVEASAVKQHGHWYAYDAPTQAAYGTPITNFNPVHTLMPPSPVTHFQQGQVNAHRSNRFNPYKKTSQPKTAAVVTKTDHLDAVTDEYVRHIKGAPTEAHFTPSRQQATKARFEQEMNASYKKMDPLNPTNRPTMPVTKPYETVPDLIEKALDNSNIVVFGENHSSLATFRTLDENIALFKRKNVKVIGIEGVVYDNKGLLKDDGMGHTGLGLRANDPDLNLQTLIKKFQDNGIEVVPLDHFYLTRHRHDRSFYTGQSTADRNLQRLKEFNYYAARELEQHTHKGKVIALVGRQHINTTQGVTGLAEATGGIGIGVYERAGMKVGYGTQSVGNRPDPMGAIDDAVDMAGDLQIFMPERP